MSAQQIPIKEFVRQTALPSCVFTVRGEPIPCGRPRSSIGRSAEGKAFVRVYADPKSASYEKLVNQIARAARPFSWRQDWAAYALSIRVYRSERRGDGDNFAKAIADGCASALWDNDSRITSWSVKIFDEMDRPRVEVMASMVGELDAEEDRKARARALADKRRRAA